MRAITSFQQENALIRRMKKLMLGVGRNKKKAAGDSETRRNKKFMQQCNVSMM